MTQICVDRQGPEMLVTGTCIFKLPFCARSYISCKASVLPRAFCGEEVFVVGRVPETGVSCSEANAAKAEVISPGSKGGKCALLFVHSLNAGMKHRCLVRS